MANNVKFKSPALPIPPAQYNQSLYQRTFSILRLYFNQLDEHLRQDLGDTTINGDLTVTGGITAGATTINGELAVNADTLKLTSTTASSTTENPSIELFRNGGSAATGAELGAIKFFGTNNASTPEKIEYAGIYAETEYNVDGSEQGNIKFKLSHAGAQEDPVMSLFSYGMQMGYGNPILMSYSNGYMQFYSPNAAQKSFKLNATPNATVANGEYDIYLPDVTSGTLAVTNSAVAFTAGATTVNGALTANNIYSQFTSDAMTSYRHGPLVELFANSTDTTTGAGTFVFTGLNEDNRKVSYGSFYMSRSSKKDDGEHKGSLVFTVADGSGAVDPYDDYTNDSFSTGHAIALNINADYFITTGYLRTDTGELKLGAKNVIKASALNGNVLQTSYDLHMPESYRAKVMSIGGIGPLDSFVGANQSVAQMIQYRGQNMVVASGGALEFELPACAASADISTTTCNIGDIFQISNAAGGALTIDRDGSGTAQTVYYFPSLTLTAFTNNPTLAVGGTMMLQAVAANVWMVFNDSGLSDA
jgi:hypothetical protein